MIDNKCTLKISFLNESMFMWRSLYRNYSKEGN